MKPPTDTPIGPIDNKGIDDWKVTSQKKSGRRWLFAALNLLPAPAQQTLGVKEFEFSENYATYFDKLERADYFLEAIGGDRRTW